jgi:hypothetical protein
MFFCLELIQDPSRNFPLQESPRWLASKGYVAEGIANLAYLRRERYDSPEVLREFAEIEATIREEREAHKSLGLKEAFFGKGNLIRFIIAFVIFFFQQWSGQPSVTYYAPQIFSSVSLPLVIDSFVLSSAYTTRIDRVLWDDQFSLGFWNLRYRESGFERIFRVLLRRDSWS